MTEVEVHEKKGDSKMMQQHRKSSSTTVTGKGEDITESAQLEESIIIVISLTHHRAQRLSIPLWTDAAVSNPLGKLRQYVFSATPKVWNRIESPSYEVVVSILLDFHHTSFIIILF
mmetsp:Transcript_36136/g.36561  ORF Transcript_36136/g.36561 Transcript_36136/m.36561 type:complete len:116 (-) Transcript_36136:283-630(-)